MDKAIAGHGVGGVEGQGTGNAVADRGVWGGTRSSGAKGGDFGGWAAVHRTMRSWAAEFGATGGVGWGWAAGGWAAVHWTSRSRAAAFGGYTAVQGDGLCFWDVAAVR
jgi:hypothetical protein